MVSVRCGRVPIEACVASRDAEDLTFEAPQVVERVATHGDLFAPTLTLHQALPRF